MATKLKKFPINMVLFGPPGVGKGVYCLMLERDLGIKAFSTGEFARILLSHKHTGTEYFSKDQIAEIERKINKGELLDDDTVNRMALPKLIEARDTGIMLDGYPRTLKQAEFLYSNLHVDILFNLHIREDLLIRKLLGRRVCPKCSCAYNIETVKEDEYDIPPMLPKKHPSKCDSCEVDLIRRKDDVEEVIVRRQKIYNDSVKDILEFYDQRGLLCQFIPKKGINDYPLMLEAVVNFVNSRHVQEKRI